MKELESLQIKESFLEHTAEILKGISHPTRLKIAIILEEGEFTVNQLAEAIKIKQSLLSQHLSIMRRLKIVKAERKGGVAKYSLINEEIRHIVSCLVEKYSMLEEQNE